MTQRYEGGIKLFVLGEKLRDRFDIAPDVKGVVVTDVKQNGAAAEKGPSVARCPGCFGAVPKGQRKRSCTWCGFDFAVVAPIRRPVRR